MQIGYYHNLLFRILYPAHPWRWLLGLSLTLLCLTRLHCNFQLCFLWYLHDDDAIYSLLFDLKINETRRFAQLIRSRRKGWNEQRHMGKNFVFWQNAKIWLPSCSASACGIQVAILKMMRVFNFKLSIGYTDLKAPRSQSLVPEKPIPARRSHACHLHG